MQLFDAATVHRALPFERLVPALRDRFAAGCEAPPRLDLCIAPAGGAAPALRSLVMPAWVPGAAYGVKVINIQPGNAAQGLPGLHACYLLFDAVTGEPRALLDGDALTARRTAATSALAAACLARPDVERLLVVGAGRVAALLPAAYRAVRPGLTEIVVCARRFDQAEAVAGAARAAGLPARAAPFDALEAECRAAEIVSCATLARAPLVRGAWLRPGTHLDLIGSFTPDMREADDVAIAQAALYVDTAEAMQKSGDLLGPIATGAITDGHCRGTLADLARGTHRGPPDAAERTVFKSVGCALEDLAAAMLVVEGGAAAIGPPCAEA